MSTKQLEDALFEAALRLAWFLKAHGSIPDHEMYKLWFYGHGLGHDAEAEELLADAREIKRLLLEMHASSSSGL
jgi:hypothetical protein